MFKSKIWFLAFFLTPVFFYSQQQAEVLQPSTSVPYQDSIVTNAIPPNNPSRNRSIPQNFGLPVARPMKPVWFGLDIGAYYGQQEKQPFTDIFFTPYLRLWYLTIAYDLTMRFDFYSFFIKKTWTDPEALISRVNVRLYYAHNDEKSYFRYISFNISTNENISMGHGRFFYDYNPAAYAPVETLKTASLSLDASFIGINAYIANIAKPDLMGTEIYVRPLVFLKNPSVEYFKNTRIYVAYAADLDATQGPYSGFYDFFPSANPTLYHQVEVGIDLPIYSKRDIFTLEAYADAFFNMSSLSSASGKGIGGGVILTFFNIFPLRVEYASIFGKGTLHFADPFYMVDRPYINAYGQVRPSKVETLSQDQSYYTVALGVQSTTKSVFFNIELSGDAAQNDLQLTTSLTLGKELLKIFSMDLFLSVRNLLGVRLFDPANDLVIGATARYHMLPNMTWEILWRMRGIIGTSFTYINGVPNPEISVKPFYFLGLGFAYRY